MAKRFIDTSYYKSPFVRGLKGALKSLYTYIICECDGAGIWAKDLEIASMYIGFEITEKDFNVFLERNKAIDLKNGRYFFPDFLEHQYPKGLSIHNPAQKNFILELQRNLLIDSDLKPLWSTFEGTKVMVMEKVEVMVKEKGDSKKYEKIEVFEKVKLTKTQIVDSKTIFLDKWQEAIETLSNYKQSSGKAYKSDYHALIGWVKNKIIKENGKQIGTKTGQQHPLQNIADLSNALLQGFASENGE